MGCDIHSFVEICENGKWQHCVLEWPCEQSRFCEGPFSWRSYWLFGMLAGVRNYSAIPPISEPRGWPDDVSYVCKLEYDDQLGDGHNHSYFTLKELLEFNYDAQVEDRRCTIRTAYGGFDCGATCEPGMGEMVTYRERLGKCFFQQLETMRKTVDDPANLRVLFFFDN